MPVSSPLGKSVVKGWWDAHKEIESVVDVGPGEGTYRKFLGKKKLWIGVEVWESYVEKYKLRDIYDKIIVGDITDIKLPTADCIIFGDVLEHMEKQKALDLLAKAREKYPHIILSIPIGKYEQGALEGNPYEEHKSTWEFEELNSLLADFEIKMLIPYCDTCPKDMGIGLFIK